MRALHVRRRTAAWVLAAGCAVSVGALCWPGTAVAQEPDVAAWWNASNLGDPSPAPPAPPDVNPGDLFVQGSNTAPAPGAPLGSAPGSAQAVAGLSFDLQPTDLVGALTLGIDGSPPPQVSVVACRAIEHFTAVENGAWTRVPGYDANSCVPGVLKDDKVEFADVAKLVQGAQLSVVVLPGPVDRVVFAKPGGGALDVTHAGSLGAGAPAFGSGTGAAPGGGASFGGGAAVPPPAAVGTPSGNLPPVGSTSSDAGIPPVVAGSAGSGATSSATSPATTPVAARTGMATSTRRWIALVVIALEVVGFALLMRSPDPDRLPLATAAAVAGGRLRPPDRTAPDRAAAPVVGGVGRFRRERRAAAPHV